MKNKIKIYLLLIAVGIGSVSCLDKYGSILVCLQTKDGDRRTGE